MWRFLKNLEIELPYDPAIPLLGIHTEETRIERDGYPNVHHSTVSSSQVGMNNLPSLLLFSVLQNEDNI